MRASSTNNRTSHDRRRVGAEACAEEHQRRGSYAPVSDQDRTCFLKQAEIVKDALSKMLTLPLYAMPELVTQFATDIAELLKKVTHVEKSEEEVLAQVAALDPRDFIDVKVPLESAGFTSVAWKAVFAKPATQAFLVLAGVGLAAWILYLNTTIECLGWTASRIKKIKENGVNAV